MKFSRLYFTYNILYSQSKFSIFQKSKCQRFFEVYSWKIVLIILSKYSWHKVLSVSNSLQKRFFKLIDRRIFLIQKISSQKKNKIYAIVKPLHFSLWSESHNNKHRNIFEIVNVYTCFYLKWPLSTLYTCLHVECRYEKKNVHHPYIPALRSCNADYRSANFVIYNTIYNFHKNG